MDQFSAPPLPPRPDLEPPKPRGSCLVWLGVLFGFVWPFVIGFAILSIIALQYLVWGWWFEKIYRSAPEDGDGSLNREL